MRHLIFGTLAFFLALAGVAKSNASQLLGLPDEPLRAESFQAKIDEYVDQIVARPSHERFVKLPAEPDLAWRPLKLDDSFNHDTVTWLRLGANESLNRLLPGDHTYYGVPFEIADANGGKAKNCVALKSDRFPSVSDAITVIVGGKARTLFFLQACAWATWGDVRQYEVRFGDATTRTVDLLPAGLMRGQSENINDWASPNVIENAVVRYVALRDPLVQSGSPENLRYLYILRWDNPEPGKDIASVVLRGGKGQSTIFLLAITACP